MVSQNILQKESQEIKYHAMKYARLIVGAYGESFSVSCPYCGSRQYPEDNGYAKCLDCEMVYKIPDGYSRRKTYVIDIQKFLTDEHRAAGMRLEEDDHCLTLKCPGYRDIYFTRPVIEEIQYEADQLICWMKSGVSFK